MQELLFVGIGGFLGAIARFIMATWITQRLNETLGWNLPVGTLFVNVIGSCLLAIFLVWGSHNFVSNNLRLLIGTGFFGAYTTFSTFAFESYALTTGSGWFTGIGYIISTNLLCLLGVVIGVTIATRIWQIAP